MPSTTLRDVAELASVSIGTASAALNRRPTVSSDTRAKVIDAAVSLGYPIKEGEALAHQNQLAVIGLLLKRQNADGWSIRQFQSRVQLGVTRACDTNMISMMFSYVEVDHHDHPISWPVMLEEQRIDGLILAGGFSDETVVQIRRRVDVPMVLLDSYSHARHVDRIITDNLGGARQAMNFLLSHGHQRIGLVGWNPDSDESIQDRYLGYLGVMNTQGYPLAIESSGLSREEGRRASLRLLKQSPEITAIFACNDETAIGVMDAAQELGLRVPQDLSLIGFDDIPLAHEIDMPLTTIHVHKSWMGSMAVNMLIERSRNLGQPKITKVVATHLVDRSTVGIAVQKQKAASRQRA